MGSPRRERRPGRREGSSCKAAPEGRTRGVLLYVERAAEGANEADGPGWAAREESAGQGGEKGPAARRRPKVAREAYSCTLSVRPRAPTKQMGPDGQPAKRAQARAARRVQLRGGARRSHARRTPVR